MDATFCFSFSRINRTTCISIQSTYFKSRMPFLLVKTSRLRRADGFTAGRILSAFANKLSWTQTSEQETKTRLQPRENRKPKRMCLSSEVVLSKWAQSQMLYCLWMSGKFSCQETGSSSRFTHLNSLHLSKSTKLGWVGVKETVEMWIISTRQRSQQ